MGNPILYDSSEYENKLFIRACGDYLDIEGKDDKDCIKKYTKLVKQATSFIYSVFSINIISVNKKYTVNWDNSIERGISLYQKNMKSFENDYKRAVSIFSMIFDPIKAQGFLDKMKQYFYIPVDAFGTSEEYRKIAADKIFKLYFDKFKNKQSHIKQIYPLQGDDASELMPFENFNYNYTSDIIGYHDCFAHDMLIVVDKPTNVKLEITSRFLNEKPLNVKRSRDDDARINITDLYVNNMAPSIFRKMDDHEDYKKVQFDYDRFDKYTLDKDEEIWNEMFISYDQMHLQSFFYEKDIKIDRNLPISFGYNPLQTKDADIKPLKLSPFLRQATIKVLQNEFIKLYLEASFHQHVLRTLTDKHWIKIDDVDHLLDYPLNDFMNYLKIKDNDINIFGLFIDSVLVKWSIMPLNLKVNVFCNDEIHLFSHQRKQNEHVFKHSPKTDIKIIEFEDLFDMKPDEKLNELISNNFEFCQEIIASQFNDEFTD